MIRPEDVETISWRVLTGNKYTKNLDPAMLSDNGYVKFMRIRRTGDFDSQPFNVVYDREYFLEWLGVRLCKPLFVVGKERIVELMGEAWDNYYNSNATARQRMAARR
jgi:hypothetical protein